MKRLFAIAAAAVLSLHGPAALAADAYPSKPIRLVVPYPPGGTTDMVNRLVAQKLSAALGQTVIVDNRPGANGNIGTDPVARSAPDGYTLLSSGGAHTINVTLYKNFRHDPLKDAVQIAMIGIAPNLMVVPNDVPAKDVRQFIAVLPQTPTLKELGYPVVGETWFGLAAPAGTPEAIVARLDAEVRRIIRMPDVQARLVENGIEPRDMDREQLRRYTADEIKKWADVIKRADIKIEP